jgi:hypothetical protein
MRELLPLKTFRKPSVAATNAFKPFVAITQRIERTMWSAADFRAILDASAIIMEFEHDDQDDDPAVSPWDDLYVVISRCRTTLTLVRFNRVS